jgi:hypothetical protein
MFVHLRQMRTKGPLRESGFNGSFANDPPTGSYYRERVCVSPLIDFERKALFLELDSAGILQGSDI